MKKRTPLRTGGIATRPPVLETPAIGQQHVLTAAEEGGGVVVRPQEQPPTPQPVTHSAPTPEDNHWRKAVDESIRLRGLGAATASAKVRPAPKARTKVGKAVLRNRVQLELNLGSFLLLIDVKITSLREERRNSPEAERKLKRYENLRKTAEAFRSTTLNFATSKGGEAAVTKSAKSFADAIRALWNRDHVEILSKSFDMALFGIGLGICYLTDASPLAILVAGVIVKGRTMVDAIKALPKKI